jgi:alkyl sulfatase BDS1-like metallo-beta-lactamase superfamily hydrolase
VPYDFLRGDPPAPDTVNPSLWRQSRLNRTNGLFEVIPGSVYQIRAFDMSNMTIIKGGDGLIIIDPLISVECAADGLRLFKEHFKCPDAVVTDVIYTHSHVDHFGGVLGVVDEAALRDGAVEIVAPDGFLEHAVSENVYAGVAMTRRAQYMYGPYLQQGPRGQVDGGLGKGQSVGRVSLAKPTRTITTSGDRLTLDGIEIEFHMTNGAEAPSEFDFYFPQFRAFCSAENATHTMHNIQTLRGAKVRDALLWSKYMNESLARYGDKTDVIFASHHWPIWNGDRGKVTGFLAQQRDMYRYLNDQTLRMLNKGYTGIEIAEVFKMPPALEKEWVCRGYYGSVNHNVKAVYDRYMGWFDGNPANLHPLPPHESSAKYVKLMNGPAAVYDAAKEAAQAGQYRWAAELLNKLLFAEPDNTAARYLQADVLEQLGYQAESAPWRNFYLMGAQELRSGIQPPQMSTADPTMTSAMTLEMIFDALAAHINGPRANLGDPISMNWVVNSDLAKLPPERVLVELSNGALSTTAGRQSATADVTIILARSTLDRLIAHDLSLEDAMKQELIEIHGDQAVLARFYSLIDDGDPSFPIVTPRSDAEKAWRGLLRSVTPTGAGSAEQAATKRKLRVIGRLPRGC